MPKGLKGFQKGHKQSNTGRTHFKKGEIPWNKNIPCSENTKKKIGKANYKGGKFLQEGYVLVLKTDHPFHNNKGYVREHRLVIEQQIGRYLSPTEEVHHLGKKNDNRPHLLMAFINNSVHIRFERNGIVKPEEIIFDGRNYGKV